MFQVGPHSRHLPLGCDRLLLHRDHSPLPGLPPVQVTVIQSLSSPALHTTVTAQPYSIWHRNTAPHCNFLRKEPGPSPGGSFLLAPLGAQSRRQFLSSSAGPSPGDIIPTWLQALLSIEAGANVLVNLPGPQWNGFTSLALLQLW